MAKEQAFSLWVYAICRDMKAVIAEKKKEMPIIER
jgi:hypothetical protein